MTRIDDFETLSKVALTALAQALRDGDRSHAAGSWMTETTGNQINHIMAHMKRIQAGELEDPTDSGNHMYHVICRAVMCLALQSK